MDVLTFLSSVVGSLVKIAWPAAVFGSVYIFRNRIELLLPFLRVKYKDLDVSFRFEQAEQEAAKLPTLDTLGTEPTPEERSKFDQIAEISPRAAILETFAQLQNEAMSILKESERLSGTSKVRPSGFLQVIRLLRGKNIISPDTSALLDDLRVIGNKAAHGTDSTFTREEAFQFRELAEKAMRTLNAVRWFEPPDNHTAKARDD